MNIRTILFSIAVIMLLGATKAHESSRLLQSGSSQAVVQFCSRFSSRNLVGEKGAAESASYKTSMATYFKTSGNDMFTEVFKSDDKMSTGVGYAQTMIVPAVFFVGPFLVGLVVIILIWPFLLCCCCCPSCCPSRCCQKPDAEPYTKCELIWPSVFLIVALLLVIVASIVGITRAGDIQNTFYAVGCSAALTFNDVINGNVSSTGTKFIGVKPLIEGMRLLDSKLGDLETQMTNLVASGGPLDQAYTQGTTLLSDLAKIPTNVEGNSLPTITYSRFRDASTTFTSAIPNVLGKASSAGPNDGLIGTTYDVMKDVNEGIIKKINDQATSFINQVNSGSSPMSSVLSDIITQMGDMERQIDPLDGQISSTGNTIDPILKIITTVVTAIFGAFIGLGVLGVVGTIIMTFCQKFRCRYLLYFICLIFVLIGIICFIITLIFSIVTPVLYLACDFLQTTISSQAGFQANFGTLLGAETTGYVKVCLPGGTGKILDQLGVNLDGIDSIDTAMAGIKNFDLTSTTNQIQQSFNDIADTVRALYYTDNFDFSDADSINFMRQLTDSSNLDYTSCSFGSDQWIPGAAQTVVKCGSAANTTGQASVAQCNTAAQISGTSSGSCVGCLDTTRILYAYDKANTVGSAITQLAARYSGVGCDWSTNIGLLWTNYYSHKQAAQPAIDRLDTVVSGLSGGYFAKLNAVKLAFTGTLTTLGNTLDTVFDQNDGMLAGLNCLLLGEDIHLIVSTTCNSLFNTFFFLRLTLAMVAFGILFSLCCITCSGVRAYKHNERRGAVLPGQEESKLEMGGHESTMGAFGTSN